MNSDIEVERARLSQTSRVQELQRELRLTDMVTVCSNDASDQHYLSSYCALIPSTEVAASMANCTWSLMHGHGMPGAVQYYDNGEERVEYLRFGDSTGIEPLVISREFHGVRPDYKEISEEFRHFHRMYHDRKEDRYYKFDESGNEELVAIVEPQRIQIRLKEIRQFIAVKEMHLALLFDCREHSIRSLDELGLTVGGSIQSDGLLCWSLNYGDFGGLCKNKTFSRLLGKHLIPPLPKEKSGFWGFANEGQKTYADFIIGTTDDGEDITHTSDPEQLANNFGANPDAPHYLTPVHFRKAVLDKYYQQPSKFSVGDNTLWCGNLWSMTMDNHHEDQVVAWLGDLGRDLSYENQLHWRSHNIAPTGGVSRTFFRRQILAQFTDSDRPEHVFQQRYRGLAEACEAHMGWPLLLPLPAEDGHHLKGVRVPASDEQKDFDDLIQSLTKVLIDSLNEKALNGLIGTEKQCEIKGSISRLEAAFIAQGVAEYQSHIAFLRKLQNLRSSGAAHRKGSNYQKIAAEFEVDSKNLRSVFSGVLGMAIACLEFMISTVSGGAMDSVMTNTKTLP
jgi:hypothetical protein